MDIEIFPLGWPWLVVTLIATAVGVYSVMLLVTRAHRRDAVLGGLGIVLSCAWWLAVVAVGTDWRDADGWVDCRDCDPVQIGTGITLSYGAVAIVLLAALIVGNKLQVLRRARSTS